MGEDLEKERARIAEEAGRQALGAGATAKQGLEAQADRVTANTLVGKGGEEAVKQSGLIYGGLIGIAVVMVQGFLEAPPSAMRRRASRSSRSRWRFPCSPRW